MIKDRARKLRHFCLSWTAGHRLQPRPCCPIEAKMTRPKLRASSPTSKPIYCVNFPTNTSKYEQMTETKSNTIWNR